MKNVLYGIVLPAENVLIISWGIKKAVPF